MEHLCEANGSFAIRLLKILGKESPSENLLFSPMSISSALAMVLMGAKGNTAAQMSQGKKTVQMMFKQARFRLGYVDEVHTQVLELPYAGEELSMVILLPDEDAGLAALEEELTYEKLRAWTDPETLTPRKADVLLPRLRLAESYDLEPILRGLGMTDAFEEVKADFSGMSTKKNVPVSKVAHKCFIEVNEEGTEAAAATAVVRNSRSARTDPRFCADHPFLLVICHRATHSLVFCGRVCSP
ncbi:serpin B8 isoform X2 [Echinops telfairi]|uniref:Serpin B8 isoform X2 n=1 Tax=Echinops telfairi TaxID=9371 RepID=A0AC55DK82_ECHTE|nr:serpin B8 isoform X2 [Echinops telfairi]